jgi:uncharacterized protein (DUF697 family)/tellurite resistance protein
MADDQALAGLKVMIAVARADGSLADAEKAQLEEALRELAPMTDLTKLLAEEFDLDDELKKIVDPEVRHATYRAALLLSVADGEAHAEESKILTKVREAYGLPDESATVTNILDAAAKKRADDAAALDPEAREKAVRARIQKRAFLAAVLGANPFPGISLITEMVIYGVQGELVTNIGNYYGHKLTRKEAASTFFGALGLGFARTAVTQLVKFVPVWGSVFGAAAAYTTTYALGRTVSKHFAEGGDLKSLSAEAKKTFDAFKKGEAAEEFEKAKKEVEKAAKEKQAEIEAAAKEVAAGQATTDDVVAKIDDEK